MYNCRLINNYDTESLISNVFAISSRSNVRKFVILVYSSWHTPKFKVMVFAFHITSGLVRAEFMFYRYFYLFCLVKVSIEILIALRNTLDQPSIHFKLLV